MSAVLDRTVDQRREALVLANEVRFVRSAFKKRLKAGATDATLMISRTPELFASMKVLDLLAAQRGWGETKAHKFLARHRISDAKTLGGLSDRQRAELVAVLPQPRGSDADV